MTAVFGDLLAAPLRSGFTIPAASRGDGVRMLNMGELFRYPRVPDVEMARVSAPSADDDRAYLQRGDLLFARRSLTLEGAGKCSIVSDVREPTTWESSIIRARVDARMASPEFLFYYFRSPRGRRQMETIVEQVAAAGIRLSELAKLHVPQPPLPEQQAIAEVLGALDDKVAANRTLADRADELMNQTIRSQPAGEEVPLSTTADFINGKAFTKGASGVGRVVVRIAELNGGIGSSTVFSDAVVDDKHVTRPGDILFAWSGSLTLHRWFRDEAIVNQHIFKVVPRGSRPAWLVYELLRQELHDFKTIAADKATTMGHIQRHHLDKPVSVPSEETVARLDSLMSALWGMVLNAERESLTLAATRDALLPQFMSGKLRVRDAEKLASEAGA